MTLDTELENSRTFSLLTESPHHILRDGQHYVAYAGYVLTYSTFSTFFMWAIAGPKIYHSIWKEREGAIRELRELNKQDGLLSEMHEDHVGQYMVDRFKRALSGLGPSDIENLLSNMLMADY